MLAIHHHGGITLQLRLASDTVEEYTAPNGNDFGGRNQHRFSETQDNDQSKRITESILGQPSVIINAVTMFIYNISQVNMKNKLLNVILR